jgi:hypothetical protein
VIHENSVVAAITKEGAAEFSDIRRCDPLNPPMFLDKDCVPTMKESRDQIDPNAPE